jgi:cytosine deaminase
VDLPRDADDPLCGVRALLGLREQLRDVLDLQVCLLASSLADTAALERALDLGVDVLGGCPHLADDPVKELTRLLDLAERRGIDVDLHTDEQLNPGMLTIRELARQVSARGLTQRVTASHCVSLGSLDPAALADVLAEVRDAGLAVVTLPITNLYLQGRESAAPVPRGLPAVRELLAAGVTVAAGGDNVRDPFNPVGRADPFETTSLLVTAAHLNAEQALHAVTDAGRTVLGLPPAGPFQGGLADLVAVQADDLTDVLAGATGSRVVLRRGRVVAATTVERHTAADLSPPTIGRPE